MAFDQQAHAALDRTLTQLRTRIEAELRTLTDELARAADAERAQLQQHAQQQIADVRQAAQRELEAVRDKAESEIEDAQRMAHIQVEDVERLMEQRVGELRHELEQAKRTTRDVPSLAAAVAAMDAAGSLSEVLEQLRGFVGREVSGATVRVLGAAHPGPADGGHYVRVGGAPVAVIEADVAAWPATIEIAARHASCLLEAMTLQQATGLRATNVVARPSQSAPGHTSARSTQ